MILLVNDDGIAAPGLRALYAELRQQTGEAVLVCAPSVEQSARAQAITLDRPLTVETRLEEGFFGFGIGGTPADCVKLALTRLCPETPRLIVSGINDGPNVGRSIFYSGTLGAAMEAAVEGFPALAVSRVRPAAGGASVPFAEAAVFAARFAAQLLRGDLSGFRQRVISLNIPATPAATWGSLRVARHGHGGFRESYRPVRQTTGQSTATAWLLHGEWTSEPATHDDADDAALLSAGHPVATLLHPDLNQPSSLLREAVHAFATRPAAT